MYSELILNSITSLDSLEADFVLELRASIFCFKIVEKKSEKRELSTQ